MDKVLRDVLKEYEDITKELESVYTTHVRPLRIKAQRLDYAIDDRIREIAIENGFVLDYSHSMYDPLYTLTGEDSKVMLDSREEVIEWMVAHGWV